MQTDVRCLKLTNILVQGTPSVVPVPSFDEKSRRHIASKVVSAVRTKRSPHRLTLIIESVFAEHSHSSRGFSLVLPNRRPTQALVMSFTLPVVRIYSLVSPIEALNASNANTPKTGYQMNPILVSRLRLPIVCGLRTHRNCFLHIRRTYGISLK